jgi:putative endonuclease
MSEKRPCVYILASKRNGTLYVGVTSDIARRAWQHRSNAVGGFVRDYGVHRLVFVEFHETMADAILREKRIKKWRRAWKLELMERHNPQWHDLYEELARERSPPVHARGRLWVPACAGTTGGRKFGTLIFATRH